MSVGEGLAAGYDAARARFLAAADAAGAVVQSHPFPDRGPSGEELAVDVAWLGPADAADVIGIVSGTHGVEGFAGSLCQSRWLEAHGRALLPDGTAVLLVHAINPYGFAWVRRVNEDNVDLNRNFADFDDPPANAGYDELAEALDPPSLSPEALAVADTALLEYAGAHGMDGVQAAVSGGQYHHPTGIFYGGSGPVRSHRLLRELVRTRLFDARRVVLLDLHTGLGERAEVELISHAVPGTPDYERAVAWWGDRVASNTAGDSVSADLAGQWMAAAEAWLAPIEVTSIALEWGTVDSITVLQALRADNWLHHHGNPTGPEADPIKADLRAAFAPDDPEWVAAVYACFTTVLDQTFAALA
ncbi:M14 family metallopeptidase [Aquihabitans sp. G128]|uniref:M14 family metallopeptidase n=1 Tax=Aquihabitans sp. G128 TaxID=2849779 RepID=UPI001C2269E4|nr:M14 family metallopeptidase [Aquihabitans sp. G128]QXC62146.1 M14 family metallopeptidase [Aquihabitans sp. G128]